jgi:nucleoside-diphosphate-sugar epimerase
MKVLYIGGTGEISFSCVLESLALGHDVSVFNRGQTEQPLPAAVRQIAGDLAEDADYLRLGEQRFDVVCQFFGYDLARVEKDLQTFAGRTGQYVFISTASAYSKPTDRFERISELRTRVHNPFAAYSQKKIEAEQRLLAAHGAGQLPVTIVRPSHTYRRRMPTPIGGGDWTARRMREALPIIVHGDGTSLWTLTHSSDFARPFARLLGNPRALGEDFHITGEGVHTWNEILTQMARALGLEVQLVHVTSDTLVRYEPAWKGQLHGDKSPSTLFDNSKVVGVAGPFPTLMPIEEGFKLAAREVIGRLEKGAGKDAVLDAKVERILREQTP